MTSIETLAKTNDLLDPFSDDRGTDGEGGGSSSGNFIHIRNQQRNGRKTLTTIQGLGGRFDCRKICKHFKKVFNCNGTVIDNEEMGEVIQLQGDQRRKVADFLIEEGLANKEEIKVHGA
uniref:SUI1 domain-containing protein n=1 Tax=Lankesteria abbotti TaxID=340204 RepID=A0A7S2VTG8_9APIC|mmetsp:Transcript_2125/g.2569  ORF Transcript_2125/g.2569 Transcript_2125/m.2569 type:complete len:119 (+) Transcript_2125:34-390(+)